MFILVVHGEDHAHNSFLLLCMYSEGYNWPVHFPRDYQSDSFQALHDENIYLPV